MANPRARVMLAAGLTTHRGADDGCDCDEDALDVFECDARVDSGSHVEEI